MIDRTKYLQMCQKVSLLKNELCGIKKDVPQELFVQYEGADYYPVSYELAFEIGNPVHYAIIHDLKANSIIKTKLEKIYRKEETI